MLESAFFLPPKAENLSLTLVTTRTIIMEKTIKNMWRNPLVPPS